MYLPEKYKQTMRTLLKDEYEAYIDSFSKKHNVGMRINTQKISVKDFLKITPFELTPIPWISNGFYYNSKIQPAKHPHYYAGLYYIQEPSAMTPASLLPINEGDKVLDLCAAPGGKSTELGAKLKGSGVLISNDISATRAKALLKNIELQGIKNIVITSEPSNKLAEYFEGYFDKILVDAPCSGEGMFRKDPNIIKNWEQYGVDYYNKLQKDIVVSAIKMLKPGGLMMYSTCTFSPKENEGTIQYILDEFPEMTVEKLPKYKGFDRGKPEWVNGDSTLENCVRLWPHKIKGEGHFMALLKKSESAISNSNLNKYRIENKKEMKYFEAFIEDNINIKFDKSLLEYHDYKIFVMPNNLPRLKGLRILRAGWYKGEEKKYRFEPSQAFAMGIKKDDFNHVINLSSKDEKTIKYLRGDTLTDFNLSNGWKLVCVDGYPLGFAKEVQGKLKNKYHTGWRWM